MHTETALSTMESEINDMAYSGREISPIIDIKISFVRVVGLPNGDTIMNV